MCVLWYGQILVDGYSYVGTAYTRTRDLTRQPTKKKKRNLLVNSSMVESILSSKAEPLKQQVDTRPKLNLVQRNNIDILPPSKK